LATDSVAFTAWRDSPGYALSWTAYSQ
jgi:hypothetical protein